jgi:hypothetical protein
MTSTLNMAGQSLCREQNPHNHYCLGSMWAMAPYQLQGDVFAGRLRLWGQGNGSVVGSEMQGVGGESGAGKFCNCRGDVGVGIT